MTALGFLYGVLPALSQTACTVDCGTYSECTTFSGLRYVGCSNGRYYFNDGAVISDEQETVDYCYCSVNTLSCADGSTLTLCNTIPLDGDTFASSSTGGIVDLEDGVAACIAADACEFVTTGCSYRGWYLQCTSGAQTRYVSAQAAFVASSADATRECNPSGGAASSTDGFCEDRIASCSTVADCSDSPACEYDCDAEPLCSLNETQVSCANDPACQWRAD